MTYPTEDPKLLNADRYGIPIIGFLIIVGILAILATIGTLIYFILK